MATKKYDAAVKVGEYTDREGNTKGKWLNVGAVLQTDNGHCLLLDRTFNPAGMPDPDGRGTVMVSLFPPKQQGNGAAAYQQQSQGGAPPAGQGADDDLSDDIPF